MEGAPQVRQELRVDFQFLPQSGRNRLAGQVVGRRTQTAGGEDDVRAFGAPLEGLNQVLYAVAHQADVLHLHAGGRQPRREICRVRVDYLAHEQLGAAGKDLTGRGDGRGPTGPRGPAAAD